MSISVPNDIMNTQALECEYHRCQTRPLDFWNCIFRHTLLPEFLAVDSKAFPGWGSPSSACSLLSLASNHRKSPKWIQSKSLSVSSLNGMSVSRKSMSTGRFAASKMASCSFKNSLWNGHHFQDIHAHSGVVVELLHKPTVDDISSQEQSWMSNFFTGKNPINIRIMLIVKPMTRGLTYFMPSMVRDVAAMFVATTHFLIPAGGGWKICLCWSTRKAKSGKHAPQFLQ